MVTTNQDGTQKYASYGGCGCAGSEVVTLTDEVGRQQKVYSDVLGRTSKTEILNWDSSVYSTSVSVFNARDQIILVNQYVGSAPTDASSTNAEVSCPSGTCQKTTISHDGYARLQSRHVPEQDAGTSTTWAYNPDDTLHSVTDARGASATYTYNNNRHLVNEIHYSAPSGITPTSNVTFGYDAAGNRTLMTDGLGNVSYAYNQLSRLMSEVRTFNDPNNSAINGVTKTLGYDYNLAGEIKSITDPFGSAINYTHDSSGRLTNIAGTGYGSYSQFASDLEYRAWGGLKHLSYGNSVNLNQQYDSSMRLTRYALTSPTVGESWVNRAQNYQYYYDSRIKFVQDEHTNLFDRSYSYDQVGRLTQALTGHEARGEQFGPLSAYNETFQYDTWGNTTNRFTRHWNHQFTGSRAYQNNRDSIYLYDSDGRVTADHWNTSLAGTINYTYDARGLKRGSRKGDNSHIAAHEFDGDGRRLKIVETKVENSVTTTTTGYEIRSSVLAEQVIAAINGQGAKTKQHVYTSSGTELASGTAETSMVFVHRDPVTGTEQKSGNNGLNSGRTELDPVGADVGTFQPIEDYPGNDMPLRHGRPSEPFDKCSLDYLPWDCDSTLAMLNGSGARLLYVRSTLDWLVNRTERDFDPDGNEVRGLAHRLRFLGSDSLGIPRTSPQTPRQPDPDAKAIRANIATALEDENCANFIKDLLGRVASDQNPLVEGGNLLKVFDKITGPGQLGLRRGVTHGGGAEVLGSIREGKGGIAFANVGGHAASKGGETLRQTLAWFDSHSALHELIHLAGQDRYGDDVLARAASKMPGAPELNEVPFPTGGTKAEIDSWVFHYSNYWDTQLRERCKPTRAPHFVN